MLGLGIQGAREVMWDIKVRDINVQGVVVEKESMGLRAHYSFLWL